MDQADNIAFFINYYQASAHGNYVLDVWDIFFINFELAKLHTKGMSKF
jgi:hypothetical protein